MAARLDWLVELAGQIKALDREARAIEKHKCELLDEHGSTLTDVFGIGPVMATEMVLRVGDPTRFASEAAFARWNGTAPVAMSSGQGEGPPTRHRLDLGGCRAINRALHIVSITQAGREPRAIEFVGLKGGPLSVASLYPAYERARASVGIEGVTIHDLRHAAGTLAAWTGATTKELMARMGHSTMAASIRYQHAARSLDAEIAERLEVFRPKPPATPSGDSDHP